MGAHVAKRKENAYGILIGKSEIKRPLWRYTCGFEGSIRH